MRGGKQPTKAQKLFWSRICDQGCIFMGAQYPAEIHHVLGSTYKHRGREIGNWFVLALNDGPHRLWEQGNVTTRKHQFHSLCSQRWPGWGLPDMTFLELQVWMYRRQLERFEDYWNLPHPVPAEDLDAILSLKSRGGC